MNLMNMYGNSGLATLSPQRQTLALILAGGNGTRLQGLTRWQSKPAVHFGGKYRTIDFPLSNCINSGVRRIGILTQYKSHSLNTHIRKGWNILHPQLGEFIEMMPAQQRSRSDWYQGTADAVYQNIDILNSMPDEYVLILAGDHIYKMDYSTMLRDHVQSGARMTVGCLEVPLAQASSFGVMSVDESGRIRRFEEKPDNPETVPGKPDSALASMGIYVFDKDFLVEILRADHRSEKSTHDFGRDIIPSLIEKHHARAFAFVDQVTGRSAYWRDVGTVDAYYRANMELIGRDPKLDLYDRQWPIWTYQEQLPPAKFIHEDEPGRGVAVNSLISGGCVVSGSRIRNCVLSSNVTVENASCVEDSIILPDVHIGSHCVIRNAIIDSGTSIPSGTVIGEGLVGDRKSHYVSPDGIVLVSGEVPAARLTHAA